MLNSELRYVELTETVVNKSATTRTTWNH